MKRIYLISLFALTIFILIGYWIKCQTGTNFSESISLSNLTPFKYLQRNDVISVPEPGLILYDSFEKRPIISNWSELWMRDEGKVTKDYDSHGIKNSRCLLVQSNSTKSWAYAHNKYVEVSEGDAFSFEGLVRIQGDKISAYMGIAAFNKQKKPVTWNYVTERVDIREKWINIKNKFVVTGGIEYIRFDLSGSGIGEFRFDDITFRKERQTTLDN